MEEPTADVPGPLSAYEEMKSVLESEDVRPSQKGILPGPTNPKPVLWVDSAYTDRPAFTNGVCVYDDPARSIWVHEGTVWLSDATCPDGIRMDMPEERHALWLRYFVCGMALEMARLGKTVSAWP